MIFLESPWPILLCGIAVEAVLAIILVRTGRGVLLWPIAGVALVVVAGVIVERLVVTERERVAQTIDEAAAAIEADDMDRLLACISPSASALRAEVYVVRGQLRIRDIKIRNLEVTINRHTSPATAKATFTALATGRGKGGMFADLGEQTHPVEVVLDLRLESGRWVITKYDRERAWRMK